MTEKDFIGSVFKDETEVETIQRGKILALIFQSKGFDYYDISIGGVKYSAVPCPIPSWLDEQLTKDVDFSIVVSSSSTYVSKRPPLFKLNEEVQIIFEDGNKYTPKISIETIGNKYKEYTVVYV